MPNFFTRALSWLRPAQQKVNPVYEGMILYGNSPQPFNMPRNYRNFASEGYAANDTVYKCISYIARNGAAIPPRLYTDRTMEKEITAHPLLDKLDRPNGEQSGVDYREAVLGFLHIAGNNFQLAIRGGKSGPPDELWNLRPDKVEIVAQQNAGIVGYRYQDRDQPYQPQDVAHLKYWHPDNDLYGLSPMEIAAILVDMQTSARKWNLALLQNAARPSGAWTTNAFLDPNTRARLEDRLKEKLQGYRNAGKIPVLDGGVTWQSMGLAPQEMDWLQAIQYNAVLIANVYNMPPQLVGDTSSSTYANMDQAKQASYTEAIFPALDKMYAQWNMWLVPMYPDLAKSAYLYYDKTTVEVIQALIQAQRTAESTRASALWTTGVAMLNEARELAGLPPADYGNVFRIGAVLVPADKLEEYAEQSLTAPAAPPPALPEPLQGVVPGQPAQPSTEGEQPNDRPSNPAESVPGSAGGSGVDAGKSLSARPDTPRVVAQALATKALDLNTEAERKAYAESVEQTRQIWETEAESRLQQYFAQEQDAVVSAVKRAALPESASDRAEHALNAQQTAFKTMLHSLYQDIVEDVGDKTAKELQDGQKAGQKAATGTHNMLTADSIAYLLAYAGAQIANIDETTLAQIQTQLAEGVAAGEGIPALAKRIDGLYLASIIPNRSKTIARTEVLGASSYAAIQAAKQSGLTLNKVWLATEDARTRADHAAADGQTVGIDDKFTVGGVSMDRPGDSSAGAAQVVNCRCTVYFKRVQADQSDEEKRARRRAYREYMEVVLK